MPLRNRRRGLIRLTAAACALPALQQAPGWESISGPLGPPRLEPAGTLRDIDEAEPSDEERHGDGTGYRHPRAPIALDGFPYNRASVWRCCRMLLHGPPLAEG